MIEIETELGIPLQELAIELVPPKQKQEAIIDLLDNHSKKVEVSVKKMVTDYIKEATVNVTVTKVDFTQMDSDNLNHGAAYFAVNLKGNKKELEKIAGNDLLFIYDWESPTVEGVSKSSKHNLTLPTNVSMLDGNKKSDMKKQDVIEKIGIELTVKIERHSWGELVVLIHKNDWHAILHPEHLEEIATLKPKETRLIHDEQGYQWMITNNGDGYNIKSKYGSNKGHFKLVNTIRAKPSKKFNSANYADRDDELNPTYMFSTTATQLLSEALKKDFDVTYLLKKELANRGLDINGKWVGFDKAKEIHKV